MNVIDDIFKILFLVIIFVLLLYVGHVIKHEKEKKIKLK